MTLSQTIISHLQSRAEISSELYAKLEQMGFSRSASKTALSRLIAGNKVKKAKLTFSNNNSLVSPEGIFNDPAILKELVEKEFYGRKNLVNLIKCLNSSHPVINRFEVAQIAAIKIGQKPDFSWFEVDKLIDALNEIGVINPYESDIKNPLFIADKELFKNAELAFSGNTISKTSSVIIKKLKYSLLESLSKWLVNNGFVSPNGGQYISQNQPAVSFSHAPFDYIGFSYLNGLVRRKQNEKANHPFVGDVLPNIVCTLAYAQSFKARIADSYGGSKKIPIGFIMAKGFDNEAFGFMKKEGFLPWCVDQIFGKNTAEAISKILTITESLAWQNEINPETFAEAFDGIENFGALFGNLKGSLFEIIIAYYASKKGYEGIELGVKIPFDESGASTNLDLDVLARSNKKAFFFECKGIGKGSEVDWVFHGKLTSDSTGNFPPVPRQSYHRFHAKLSTFGGCGGMSGKFAMEQSELVGLAKF